jgi:hypothetical protein
MRGEVQMKKVICFAICMLVLCGCEVMLYPSNASSSFELYIYNHTSEMEWDDALLERVSEELAAFLEVRPIVYFPDSNVRVPDSYHVLYVEITEQRNELLYWYVYAGPANFTIYTATIYHVFYEHNLTYETFMNRGRIREHSPMPVGREINIRQNNDVPIEVGERYIMFLRCGWGHGRTLQESLLFFQSIKIFESWDI